MTPRIDAPATGEAGFALLVMLWALVVLGALAAGIVVPGRYDSGTAHVERCRLEGRYAAAAGVADAIDRLAGVDPGRPPVVPASPERPGLVLAFEAPVGRARYRTRAVDLGSRLDVNRADAAALGTVFREAGLDAGEADRLAEAILDWIDPDQLHRPRGAEAEAYRSAGAARLPRDGPVVEIEELLDVRGMTPALLHGAESESARPAGGRGGVARWLTVRGTGRIHLNTAPREVLATLPGFTPEIVTVVEDLRRRRPIRSIGEIAIDPRVGDPMRLQPVAMKLLERTTTEMEAVEVRSWGLVPGCRTTTRIDAELWLGDVEGPRVAAWSERLAPAPESG